MDNLDTFPHDYNFGTLLVLRQPAGDYKQEAFFFLFEKQATGWVAHFADEIGNTYGMHSFGDTEREAYERLITQYEVLNGGTRPEIVLRCKPIWDNYFDEDGHMHPFPVKGEGLTADVVKGLSDI